MSITSYIYGELSANTISASTIVIKNITSGTSITSLGLDEYGVIVSGETTTTPNSYWTSGSTGLYSIKADNDSGLDATGNYSVAEGYNTLASGDGSHAEGYGGKGAVAASGLGSHAEGQQTTASGDGSHAEGRTTEAIGQASHAEGQETIASGQASHAEGQGTTAMGNQSHAEGLSTTSTGDYSHSEGYITIAIGQSSHAEGQQTTASGASSHAEGLGTTALSDYSHAGGSASTASGAVSFIHSTSSLVTGDRSVILGGQNITGTTADTVYVPNLNINTAPSNDDSLTQVLVRDTDGSIKYRSSSSLSGSSTSAGPFGISNSGGTYTYYSTLPEAMSAATSGQTIEVFADVNETESITLKSGVNINGNGHIYNYTNPTGNTFIDNGVAVVCTINNLNISRTNYTSGSVYVQSSSSSDTDWNGSKINITATSGDAVSVLGKIRNIWVKVTGNGNGINSAYASNAQFFNCYAEVTGSGVALYARTSTVYSCTAIGVSGVGCYGDQSSHYNCYYFATSGYALQYGNIYNSSLVTVSGQASRLANAYNCSILSTSGLCAVNQSNTFVDCTLRNGSGEVTLFTTDYYNCNLYTASNRISTGYSNNFYNSVLHSGWNNASGHCLTAIANNEIVNSTLIVSNASANCLNSASAISVKYANNTFKGATTPVNANITQGIVNTQDNQGNILL